VNHGYAEYPVALGCGDGFHIWPRGDFLLIAQPNTDGSCTATLFLPLDSFRELCTAAAAASFFARHFPDVSFSPRSAEWAFERPPAPLKAIYCHPFDHGSAILLGDAAHTMLPFYGQGINCGFEDVRVLCDILDWRSAAGGRRGALRESLREFSRVRSAACEAIVNLSLANLRELAHDVGDARYHARASIERELFRRHPERFAPLYCMIAFSREPYDQALARYLSRRSHLDALCEKFNVESEADRILEAFSP
jgi:kynurenine 3-monooxygenase